MHCLHEKEANEETKPPRKHDRHQNTLQGCEVRGDLIYVASGALNCIINLMGKRLRFK